MTISPKLKKGDRVVVRAMSPPPHTRTPSYLHGKPGVIELFLALLKILRNEQ